MLVCRLLLVSSSPSVKERRFTDIISSVAEIRRTLTSELFSLDLGWADLLGAWGPASAGKGEAPTTDRG
jgi:hypothetical protein